MSTTYYRISEQQRIENERQARKDAKGKRKGHKSAKSPEEVEHERYMRSMGL